MKKLKKISNIYYIIGAFALILIIILLTRKRTSGNNVNNPVINQQNNDDFPLGFGSAGDNVKDLQTILVRAGYDMAPYGVDGVFGTETLKAVRLLFGKDTVDYNDMVNYVTNTFGWSHLFW